MADSTVTIQLPADASADLISRIKATFPDALIAESATAHDSIAKTPSVESLITQAVAAAPDLPAKFSEWWAGLGGGTWPLVLLAFALIGAYAVEFVARVVFARTAGDLLQGEPFTARAPRGLRWSITEALALFLFFVATLAIANILAAGNEPLVAAIRLVLSAAVFARVQYMLIIGLSAPNAPGRRLMGFTDAEAAMVARMGLYLVVAGGLFICARAVIFQSTAGGDAGVIGRIAFLAGNSFMTAWFFWRTGTALHDLTQRSLGNSAMAQSKWLRLLSTNLSSFYIGVVLLDFLIKAAGLVGALGSDATNASGSTITTLVLTPLAIAGLRVWQGEADAEGRKGLSAGVFALAEGMVMVAGGVILMRAWGLDPFAPTAASGIGRILPGLVEAAVSVVVGVALWRVSAAFLTQTKKAELDAIMDEEVDRSRTRLETVLPILRNFVFVAIGVITVMAALSALGVNIAPLLASAGVLGLAIGFGAQKLVGDIIAGLFYVYEDAFRIGEYIETGKGKGTVERISLRSAILRHHRGPLFTIPFSEMGTIQNHSRDWVKIKFTFAVPATVDLEMVRKAVKKVGEALELDPELNGKFIEPLKSQGALGIKGRSYEIGCKFTTRPGEQFLVRRKVYAALQKALKEKNIDLFAPQLTIATDDPLQPLATAP